MVGIWSTAIMFVADLTAKSQYLSMSQCFCSAIVIAVLRVSLLTDIIVIIIPKTPEIASLFCIRNAWLRQENWSRRCERSTVFSEMLPGLPLSACIDYKNCVLISVYQSLLKQLVKLADGKHKLRAQIPKPFKSSVWINSSWTEHMLLNRTEVFQKEWNFQLLFWCVCDLHRGRFLAATSRHYLKLVYGIELHFKTSVNTDKLVAGTLLYSSCREAVVIFGTEKSETKNLHCSRHLSHQSRKFGPLLSLQQCASNLQLNFLYNRLRDSGSERCFTPTLPWKPSSSQGRHGSFEVQRVERRGPYWSSSCFFWGFEWYENALKATFCLLFLQLLWHWRKDSWKAAIFQPPWYPARVSFRFNSGL